MKLSAVSVRSLLRTFSVMSDHPASMLNALKAEMVLSESNRKTCIERFKSYKTPKLRNAVKTEAAVLIPLCLYKGELGLLYTLRSMKLSTNGGQVSFPGGMRDKNDADLQETALRETWEELKIPKEKIDVWAMGNLIIARMDVNVMPVLGYIGEVVPEELEINTDEVEEAFVVSLRKLCDPELCHFTRFNNYNIVLPSYLGGKYRIWGFTAAITHIALECLVPEIYMNKIPEVRLLKRDINKEMKSQRTFKQNTTQISKL